MHPARYVGDWREQSSARIARLGRVVLVGFLLGLFVCVAFAQTCTTNTWDVSNGQGYTSEFGWADDGCGGFTTWGTGNGWTAISCTGNIATFTANATAGGVVYNWTGTRQGCTGAPPPPSSSASSSITATLVLPSWIDMTPGDGFELSMLIIGCWLAAAVFRWLGSALWNETHHD